MWTLLDGATGAMHPVENAKSVINPLTKQSLNFTLMYTRGGVEMYHGLDSAPFTLQLPEPYQYVMLRGPMVLLQGDVETWRALAMKSKTLSIPALKIDDEEVGAVAKAAAKAAQKRHAHTLKTLLRKRNASAPPSSPLAPTVLAATAADESEAEESCINDDVEEEMEDLDAEEEELQPPDEEDDVEISDADEVY
jgi:hypothetical protein